MSQIVSPVTEDDIETILRIAKDCDLSEWTGEDYSREIGRADSIFLKVENSAGELLGFIIGRIIRGANEHAPEAEIYNIGVAPQSQHLGLGGSLIDAFATKCSTAKGGTIFLEVRAGNSNALKFYEKHGFAPISIRKGFYSDPEEDAIVMRLEILPTSATHL